MKNKKFTFVVLLTVAFCIFMCGCNPTASPQNVNSREGVATVEVNEK